jgi:hypothetical protein
VASPTTPELKVVAQVGGSVTAVTGDGANAYAVIGKQLWRLDLSNPGAPKTTGEPIDSRAGFFDVVIVDGYAYVADREGLRIIDVSRPSQPREVGTFETEDMASAVAIVDGVALLAVNYQALSVVDVSDPTDPSEVAKLPIQGSVQGIRLAGDRAYVFDGSGDLYILDVSAPAEPQLLAGIENVGKLIDLCALGTHVLVTEEAGGLRVIDVADPEQPTVVATVDVLSAARLWPAGDHIFVADSAGLHVLNLSDPRVPIERSVADFPGSPFEVHVVGDLALVATGSEGLRVIDVSDLDHPREAAAITQMSEAKEVAVAGRHAFVASILEGLYVFDVTDPAAPVEVAVLTIPSPVDGLRRPARAVRAVGDRAFVSGTDLHVLDIADPLAPRVEGSLDIDGWSLEVDGDRVYIASGVLSIVDASDPATPRITASIALSGWVSAAYPMDDLVLVGTHETRAGGPISVDPETGEETVDLQPAMPGGLRIVDVSDPAAPRLVGSLDTRREPGHQMLEGPYGGVDDVTAKGTIAYLAALEGLVIVDVSDPTAPQQVEVVQGLSNASAIEVIGDRLYASRLGRLRVFDISDPVAPRELAASRDLFGTGRFAVRDGYAYVANGIMWVVDVSERGD